MVSSPFHIKYKSLKSGGEKKGEIVQKMHIFFACEFQNCFFQYYEGFFFAKTCNISLTMSHITVHIFFFINNYLSRNIKYIRNSLFYLAAQKFDLYTKKGFKEFLKSCHIKECNFCNIFWKLF
jgi:hypothetical protein